MNPFTWIDHVAKSAVAHLVPPAMEAELGSLAHSFTANIAYDARHLGVAAEDLAKQDVESIWETIKQVMVKLGPSVLAAAYQGNIAKAVEELSSGAIKVVLPALAKVGSTTLQAMVSTAASMVVSGVLAGNPTSAPASSSAVSSAR